MTRAITWLVLAHLGACDCSESSPAPAETASRVEEPAEPAVEPEARTAEPAAGEGPERRRLSDLGTAERQALLAAVPLIREGQRLGRAGDHAAALAAFERALELAPAHPGALCEAGWQAFHLDDLARARALLDRGARLSVHRRRRAACLYNLGRVHEAEQRTAQAAEAYAESLELRPNETVRSRLAALNVEDDRPTVAGLELFPTVEALCEYVASAEEQAGSEHAYCERRSTPVQPFADGELFILDDAYQFYGWTYHHLALHTPAGYGALTLVGESESHHWDTIGQEAEIEEVRVEQRVDGGPEEIVVRVTTTFWDESGLEVAYYEQCESQGLEVGGDECEDRIAALPVRNSHWTETHEFVCAEVDGLWDCGEETPGAVAPTE